MSLHELFDVSVLFPTADAAEGAFREVFRTASSTATLAGTELTGLATLGQDEMSSEDVDRRLVGAEFPLGQGYVGLKLGIMDQFSLHMMRTDDDGVVQIPDPWRPEGRMREATQLVLDLLELGGHAVLLHKAAAAVKSAAMFREQAGDLSEERGERPFMAWLDVLATQGRTGGAGECRSYGMPHYFGEPNIKTIVPHDDQYSIERSMQALKYICALMAARGLSGRTLPTVRVPVGYLPGRRDPESFDDARYRYTWRGSLSEDGLLIEYRVDELPTQHPWVGWSSGDVLDFDVYTKAVSDFVLADIAHLGMTQFDAVRYDATDERPEVKVLLHDNGEMFFFVTAGLGRIATPNGRVEHATLHAELCLFAQEDNPMLESVLLNIGTVLHATPVDGGVKDWDSLPPESGWGFLLVPMKDIALGNDARPLALRALVALPQAEYEELRETEDRQAWFNENVGGPAGIALRWTDFCQHFARGG